MNNLILIPLAIGVAVAAWLILRGFKKDQTKKGGGTGGDEPSPRKGGGTGGDEGNP